MNVDRPTFDAGGWSAAGSDSYPKTDINIWFDGRKDAFQCEDQLRRKAHRRIVAQPTVNLVVDC